MYEQKYRSKSKNTKAERKVKRGWMYKMYAGVVFVY
jgi:hypothetical protein